MSASQDFINSLVISGALTTSLAVQEAAEDQINNASTGSSGITSDSVNQAWGKAIPTLIGHTRTVCLPIWTGNPVATVNESGDETDTIDFAVIVGRGGPRYETATLSKVWFDNVLVYDAADPLVTTLTGAALQFAFYDGLQATQDPTILAAQGPATPAFTNTIYVVFKGLITRVINATTTITQFNKLPEVQCEVLQTAANIGYGAVITPFASLPSDSDNNYYAIKYLSTLHELVKFNVDSVDRYDINAMQYLGRTTLVNFASLDNKFEPLVLLESGILLVCNGLVWRAWDTVSGALLSTNPNDARGDNDEPDGYGQYEQYLGGIYDIGDNRFLCKSGYLHLFAYNGNSVDVLQGDISNGLFDEVRGLDYPLTTPDIPSFTGSKIVYVVTKTTLRRCVVSGSGKRGSKSTVGKVTNDGSGYGLEEPCTLKIIYTLNDPGEEFIGVLCETDNSSFVYALVSGPLGLQLRTYATFYYYNPQNGQLPANGAFYRYSDYSFVSEYSRLSLPSGSIKIEETIQRDKRYNTFGYVGGGALYIVNFKQGFFHIYSQGLWQDAQGNAYGEQQWDEPVFVLPRTQEVLYFKSSLQMPNAYMGKAQPIGIAISEARYTLANLFTDCAVMAGYDVGDVACSGMDDLVTGMQLNQTVNFADLIAQFCAVFRVDMIETELGGLSFWRRPHTLLADFDIEADSLLAGDNGNTVEIDRVATNELPTFLQLSFINEDFGFVVGAATVRRTTYPFPTAHGTSTLALSVPIVMGNADAVYYAGLALFDMWAGKTSFTIRLPLLFVQLQPGDFVSLTRRSGRVNLCKVIEIDLGADYTLNVTLSSVNSLPAKPLYQNALTPSQVQPLLTTQGHGTFTTLSPKGNYVTVVDNVALSAADIAEPNVPLYIAASAPTDVYTQIGSDAPVSAGSIVQGMTMGKLTAAMPDTDFPFETDIYTVVTLDLVNGVPTSVSEDDFRSGANQVLIGAPGRWELAYFRDVAITGNSAKLSKLLRGRAGTEGNTGTHVAGDLVVFGAAALLRLTVPASMIGNSLRVYGMPLGAPAAATGGVFDTLPVSGAAQAPRRPLEPSAMRGVNGDVAVVWHRQDRAAPASFWDDPPQSETREQWTISIVALSNNGTTQRQASSSVAAFIYTAAMQAEDGNTLAKRLSVTIAQVSTKVGAGTAYKGYINVK